MPDFLDYLENGNEGDAVDLVGGGDFVEIARAIYKRPMSAEVITAHGSFRGSSDPGPGITPRVVVLIRHGIAGAQSFMRTLAGTSKTVSGTMVSVSAKIALDDLGLVDAPNTVTCKVAAMIAAGQEGEGAQPTRWYRSNFGGGPPPTLTGAVQTARVGQGRIKQANVYNMSATLAYVMFFDWPRVGNAPNSVPPQSEVPILTLPLDGIVAGFSAPWKSFDGVTSKIDFTWGLTWQTSSTGDVYTPDAGGNVKVDIEFFEGEEVG